MTKPAVRNIKLQRRADYNVVLEFKDSNLNPTDLLEWQVFAQVWDLARESKLADFDVEYLDTSEGRVRLHLPHTVTADLPSESLYDVLLINPYGERAYYVEGTLTALESCTVVP